MFGVELEGKRAVLRLWAPDIRVAKLKILDNRLYQMERNDVGWFEYSVDDIREGARYFFVVDGKSIPDPASKYQPDGIYGPSEIVSPNYPWRDEEWKGLDKEGLVIYEIHTGTFSSEGIFSGVAAKLEYLRNLGVTSIELMPVNQFPGNRGWGYDGVFPFAVQNSYGGPAGLKALVNAAHLAHLGVILDVVYNHVGPEANYMQSLGPYFSKRYRTPWGLALNFDDSGCDEVRRMVLENLEFWIREYHIDGFRLDAVHAIVDNSPRHILEDIADAVHKRGRLVIAESDLNDPRIVNPKESCGYGLDAQWLDDFHHSIHSLLTGERAGYYSDFGSLDHLVRSYQNAFVYDGRYSVFRKKTHGSPVDPVGCRFVVYIQNHDQVGNRGKGDRISTLLDIQAYMLASAAYVLSGYIPMLFMGEEYGERSPFYYFSDFSDPALIDGVRQGRRIENNQFTDPQSDSTFQASKLSWNQDESILRFYRELLKARKAYLNGCRDFRELSWGEHWFAVKTGGLYTIYALFDTLVEVAQPGYLLVASNPSFPEVIAAGRVRVNRGVGVYRISG
jgi:maltooligosyltrehalose trehalohydrolase